MSCPRCSCDQCTYERVLAAAPEGSLKEYLRNGGIEALHKMQEFFGPVDE